MLCNIQKQTNTISIDCLILKYIIDCLELKGKNLIYQVNKNDKIILVKIPSILFRQFKEKAIVLKRPFSLKNLNPSKLMHGKFFRLLGEFVDLFNRYYWEGK